MKRLSLLFLTMLLLAMQGFAGEKENAAAKGGEQWLALVDAGSYDQSWDAAASMFKNAVAKEDWNRILKATRVPLGPVKSRKLRSAKYETSLPGAPDGEYVVLQFDTSFENKKSSVETVTPKLEDGEWKVSGYFIK